MAPISTSSSFMVGKFTISAIFLLMALWCYPVFGVITLDGTIHGVHDNGSTSATTAAVTIGTPTAGDLITCEVDFSSLSRFVSVSDNVNSGNYKAAVEVHFINNTVDWQTGIYYKENVAASATTVTLTYTTSTTFGAIACQAWKGAATSNSLDLHLAPNDKAATANPNSGQTVTPNANNELIIGFVMAASGVATAGTNYTVTDSDATNLTVPEFWIQTTATATNTPYTLASTDWAEEVASFGAASITQPTATYTGTSSNSGVTAGLTTVSAAAQSVTGGNMEICNLRWVGAQTISSISDGFSDTFASQTVASPTGNVNVAVLYGTVASTHASLTMSATLSGASTAVGLNCDQFSGMTNWVVDKTATGSNDAATGLTSGTFTTTAAQELVYAAMTTNNVNTTETDNGAGGQSWFYSLRPGGEDNGYVVSAYLPVATTLTSASFSMANATSAKQVMQVVTFKAAPPSSRHRAYVINN